jgi:hypothetical protein
VAGYPAACSIGRQYRRAVADARVLAVGMALKIQDCTTGRTRYLTRRWHVGARVTSDLAASLGWPTCHLGSIRTSRSALLI